MWIVGGLVLWVLLAFAVAVVIGRGIRIADVADERVPATATAPRTGRVRTARRRVPLPPVGVALAATAVLLETVGYVVRFNGTTGPVARALSMDAPWSAPRTFVAALFAGAAVAAVAGAVRAPGRRTWWLAVGLVSAGIAVVKAGGTVHVELMSALETYLEESGEALAGVAVLVAVLVGVAPRLVLPASWVLRRNSDAATLDVPEQLPHALRG
ncbi:hypothetical protein SAMN05660350_05057 [Geodermatophilus obscurus]|uniref:Uncharacterized protein n=1 Tax=Geodermatophilus obscurus TaxID=1861 RepID=A0A1M7V1J4_9ACTN|nr:hypothetical protein [Geodermatophilus obscurus]SHN89062.1 hypothetical protein SAMN05660350_05057 [Geodermatophilus obscurus]